MPARFLSYLDEDTYFLRLMSTPVATRRLTNHRAGARNSVRRLALTGFCGPDRGQRRIAKNRWVSPGCYICVYGFELSPSHCQDALCGALLLRPGGAGRRHRRLDRKRRSIRQTTPGQRGARSISACEQAGTGQREASRLYCSAVPPFDERHVIETRKTAAGKCLARIRHSRRDPRSE